MALQYLNYIDGEIYGDQTGASRFSYRLNQDSVELTLEYQATPDIKGYSRFIWSGTFTYRNQKLTNISVADVSFALGDGTHWSIHFSTPQSSFPTDAQSATKINYHYSSSGSGSTTTASGGGYELFKNFPVSTSRSVIQGYAWSSRISENWWKMPFEAPSTAVASTSSTLTTTAAVDTLTGTAKKADTFEFSSSPNYNSSADRITNFSTKDKDKVQISSSVFGLSGIGTFKIAKNSKELTKLLASDIQFIYNKGDGGLYFNQNGTEAGYGTGGIFAVLEGKPTLGTSSVSVVA